MSFQFPLHRDPRCNWPTLRREKRLPCFSSLYIGILAATILSLTWLTSPCSFSSLYIGILAATESAFLAQFEHRCFSSLYIGILAATTPMWYSRLPKFVSVPFTSGSSLQQGFLNKNNKSFRVSVPFTSGSSLQPMTSAPVRVMWLFQFPLHRDPRCNK